MTLRRRLLRAEEGATLVEFGLVSPILIMLLLGLFDIAHTLYVSASLQGLMQKAARDSTLQDDSTLAQENALDANIRTQILMLDSQATVTTTRRFYRDYNAATAKTPEPWQDADKDGACDHGEYFTDSNGNGVWDADGGDGGSTSSTPGGGAQDRTIYTVNVSYPRLMPIWKFIGSSNTTKLKATTVLANQPYADQSSYSSTPASLKCS